MADTFQFEIVTPDKIVLKEQVEAAQIPAKNGYIGVLPGHAPLITELGIGEMSYTMSGTTNYLAIAWGFAEVLPDKVTILAESAERPEDIDTARAEEAKRRAEQRLRDGGAELDYKRAQDKVKKAEVRLQVAAHAGAGSRASH